VTIRIHDGVELTAVPVRVAPREDVALLRTEPRLAGVPCVPLRRDTAGAGTEVFAVGAPTSLALAFSLTRGIVSGYPLFGGHRRMQTDAPVSPGNSGGPLVDGDGAALGVVSSKITSAHAEGLAFAVPLPEALAALALRVGDATDPALLTEKATVARSAAAPALTDTADPVPSLVPGGDAVPGGAADGENAGEGAAPNRHAGAKTPGYIKAMRWGGVAVASGGALVVLGTYATYAANKPTHGQFDGLRTWNTVGWTAAIAGAGAFVLSYVLQPAASKHVSLHVSPMDVHLEGAF
jgi:hypothetical protein